MAEQVEYLWLPCSWMEQRGPMSYEATADGVVKMIPVNVRAKLRASTTEQLVARKKTMHVTAFRYLADDLRDRLETIAASDIAQDRLARDPSSPDDPNRSVDRIVEHIMKQCERAVLQHEAIDAVEYTNEGRFRDLSLAMVDTVHLS